MSYFPNRVTRPLSEEDEQGEIRSSDSDQELEDEEVGNMPLHVDDDEIFDSASSDQDRDRVEEEKKKREDFYKTMNQQKPDVQQNQFNWYENAVEAAAKTNKKMLILRKKNLKRIGELDNIRRSQQAHLTSSNIHYRSSINQYPLLTIDDTGKKYVHPNSSLRVSECRLDQFIQKNIAEEGTSNYLNEVVKFENFAYQHRKKRRQHLE